jgi:hypothetical protein
MAKIYLWWIVMVSIIIVPSINGLKADGTACTYGNECTSLLCVDNAVNYGECTTGATCQTQGLAWVGRCCSYFSTATWNNRGFETNNAGTATCDLDEMSFCDTFRSDCSGCGGGEWCDNLINVDRAGAELTPPKGYCLSDNSCDVTGEVCMNKTTSVWYNDCTNCNKYILSYSTCKIAGSYTTGVCTEDGADDNCGTGDVCDAGAYLLDSMAACATNYGCDSDVSDGVYLTDGRVTGDDNCCSSSEGEVAYGTTLTDTTPSEYCAVVSTDGTYSTTCDNIPDDGIALEGMTTVADNCCTGSNYFALGTTAIDTTPYNGCGTTCTNGVTCYDIGSVASGFATTEFGLCADGACDVDEVCYNGASYKADCSACSSGNNCDSDISYTSGYVQDGICINDNSCHAATACLHSGVYYGDYASCSNLDDCDTTLLSNGFVKNGIICSSACVTTTGADCCVDTDCTYAAGEHCRNNVCTDLTANKKFKVKTKVGETVAFFDSTGNGVLKGTLTSGSPCSAPINTAFVVKNGADIVAWIDSTGNMCIDGALTEVAGLSLFGCTGFVIKNSVGLPRMCIDKTNGNLLMGGYLTQNGKPNET